MGLYFRLFRNTNLDICLGACANAYYFSRVQGVRLEMEVYFLLFTTVWVIYTLDRLFDTQRPQGMVLPRHVFYIKYRNWLFATLALLVLSSVYLLLRVDTAIVLAGLILSILVAIYLVMMAIGIRIPKEPVIALLYTAGVSLAPLALSGYSILPWSLLAQHSLLAFANLLVISWFEREADRKNQQANITQKLINTPAKVYLVILVPYLICATFSIWKYPLIFQWPLLLVWVVILGIWVFRSRLGSNDLYGILLDGAFYIPAMIWLW